MTAQIALKTALFSLSAALISATLGCNEATSATPPRAPGRALLPGPTPIEAPAVPGVEAVDTPPQAAPLFDVHLPRIAWTELRSGLRVGVLRSATVPWVDLRLVVLGGRALDGERTGLAVLTTELLQRGSGAKSRALLARAEAIGATITTHTELDYVVLGLSAPRESLDEATDVLLSLARTLDPSPADFARAKAYLSEARRTREASDGDYGARLVMFEDLYDQPLGRHPYSSFEAHPAELQSLSLNELRAYHKRMFVPSNMVLVAAGDVRSDEVLRVSDRVAGAQRAPEPQGISFSEPNVRTTRKVTIVDVKGAESSLVTVGWLGPTAADPRWPAARLAAALIAQEVASMGPASSALVPVANSPSAWLEQVLVTKLATAEAVQKLFDATAQVRTTIANDAGPWEAQRTALAELEMARSTLEKHAVRGAELRLFGLPDDADESYVRALSQTTPEMVARAAHDLIDENAAVVVVTGDAEVIGPSLARFADVKILDPAKGFERERTLRYNPDAPMVPDGPPKTEP